MHPSRLRALHPALLVSPVGQLILIVAVLLFAAGARAQDEANTPENQQRLRQKPPRVVMQVSVGHGNATKSGAITPIRVALQNFSDPLIGRIEIRDRHGNRTNTLVELPRRANKVYHLYVPVVPLDYSPEVGTLTLFEGRKRLLSQVLTPTLADEARLVLTATGDGSGLQFLHEAGKLEVTTLGPADLPRQWAGYEPATMAVLDGQAWSQMDDEQKRALRMWVEQGGRAILCGETTTEWRDPEARALIGVTPTRVVNDRELSVTAPWGGSACRFKEGSALTVSGPLAPRAESLFEEDGRPLVVHRIAGEGQVLWMGFNPFREAVREWEGSESFWRGAIQHLALSRSSTLGDGLSNSPDAITAAQSLPRLPAPPLAAIVVFGLSYAVIFGPVNIAVLRRLRRTVRAWLFVPALALGMTLIVLAAGQSWGNARTVVNSLSVLYTSSGGRTAREDTLTGIFSPTNRAFDLSVDDPAVEILELGTGEDGEDANPINLDWPDYQSDGELRWEQVALQLYATRVLQHSRPRDLGGSVHIHLQPDGSGEVRNGTSLPIRGAYLTRAGRYHWIGDLSPGDRVRVDARKWSGKFSGSLPSPPAGGHLRENQIFRENVERLWRGARDSLLAPKVRQDTWLIGETSDARGGLQVSDVPLNNRTALLLVRGPEAGRR